MTPALTLLRTDGVFAIGVVTMVREQEDVGRGGGCAGEAAVEGQQVMVPHLLQQLY